MSIIKTLSDSLINKIAAGEVIERPASVAKELVENSLDAKSAEISVDIINSGKKLIRVSDNGIGMDREDALKCFKRHATSKIDNESDLFNIKTMGFRGEALSSIASVSRMRIMTAQENSIEGTLLEIQGEEIKTIKDKAVKGTTIEVRDLFYNTPARKKSLKASATELYHITDIVTQAALSYPVKRFNLNSDGKDLLNLPAASGAMERILQIYGSDFLKGLEHFESIITDINIEGFISKEGNYRKTRSHQYLLVNNRPIRDNSLRHAIYLAYKDILPSGNNPLFFIYINTDPSYVDVNVHPAKREIRFYDKEGIYRILHSLVKQALFKGVRDKSQGERDIEEWTGTSYKLTEKTKTINATGGFSISGLKAHGGEVKEPAELPYITLRNFIYVGDVFAAYSNGKGICILDHHASHERILYEGLKDGVDLNSHKLLFPVHSRLPKKEFSILLEHLDEIKKMGMDIEEFGADTFIIRSLPVELDGADITAILSDIASHIADKTSSSPLDEIKDIMAKRIACHESVRGRERLSNEELNKLLRDLELTEDPYHCPHGRPTQIYFSHDELERMFKRK